MSKPPALTEHVGSHLMRRRDKIELERLLKDNMHLQAVIDDIMLEKGHPTMTMLLDVYKAACTFLDRQVAFYYAAHDMFAALRNTKHDYLVSTLDSYVRDVRELTNVVALHKHKLNKDIPK